MKDKVPTIGKLFSIATIILSLVSGNASSQLQNTNLDLKASENTLSSVTSQLES